MAPTSKRSSKDGRIGIVSSISTPLGFYVLALLIIEATLSIVLSCSKLSEKHVWDGFICMLVIFLAIIIFVTYLAVFNPQHLLYGKEEHSKPSLENEAVLEDQIEDLIFKNVRLECLKTSRK
jgi:energy-coupling factor transporter transmembrane protein EcfT